MTRYSLAAPANTCTPLWKRHWFLIGFIIDKNQSRSDILNPKSLSHKKQQLLYGCLWHYNLMLIVSGFMRIVQRFMVVIYWGNDCSEILLKTELVTRDAFWHVMMQWHCNLPNIEEGCPCFRLCCLRNVYNWKETVGKQNLRKVETDAWSTSVHSSNVAVCPRNFTRAGRHDCGITLDQ